MVKKILTDPGAVNELLFSFPITGIGSDPSRGRKEVGSNAKEAEQERKAIHFDRCRPEREEGNPSMELLSPTPPIVDRKNTQEIKQLSTIKLC